MARVSETGIKDIFTLIDAGDNGRLQALLSSRSGAANARNLQNVSALMYALYRRNHDAVRMLRDKLMSLDVWEAAALGDDRQLRAMLQPGVDPNAYSADGYTPLQLASFFGRPDTVVLLLEAGADPNLLSANPARTTALHGAAVRGYVEVSQRLIEAGADVTLRAANGFTALDAALKHGDHALITLIAEASAKSGAARPEPAAGMIAAPVNMTLKSMKGTKLGGTIGAKTPAAKAGRVPAGSAEAPAVDPAPTPPPAPTVDSAAARAAATGGPEPVSAAPEEKSNAVVKPAARLTVTLSGKVTAPKAEPVLEVAPKRKLSSTLRSTRNRTK